MEQLKAMKTEKQHKTKQNLQRYAHGYKVMRKTSINPLNSYYANFLFADIDSTPLTALS